MTALDQPLKMHKNQERSIKEQMDGSARPLHDKNVWFVDDNTCVRHHQTRSPSRPFAISTSSDDLGHTVRKSPVQLKLPLKTCQFNVVHTERPPRPQTNTGVSSDISSMTVMCLVALLL